MVLYELLLRCAVSLLPCTTHLLYALALVYEARQARVHAGRELLVAPQQRAPPVGGLHQHDDLRQHAAGSTKSIKKMTKCAIKTTSMMTCVKKGGSIKSRHEVKAPSNQIWEVHRKEGEHEGAMNAGGSCNDYTIVVS